MQVLTPLCISCDHSTCLYFFTTILFIVNFLFLLLPVAAPCLTNRLLCVYTICSQRTPPTNTDAPRRSTLDVFVHSLNLDLDYHLHRKTGELLSITTRGSNAIQSMLSMVVFSLGPQVCIFSGGGVFSRVV